MMKWEIMKLLILYEAIEDLESLQNRKCENCKYNKEQDIVFLVKPQHNFMIFL